MAKRARKRKIKKASKTNKNNLYLPIIILLVVVFAFVIFYFSSAKSVQPSGGGNEIPSTSSTETQTSVGGNCKTNYECFVTSCKGQAEDCINATQMAIYPKNCKTYSDWTVKQDASKCDCEQNACTMR